MIFQARLQELIGGELCQFFGCQMESVEGIAHVCDCLFRFHLMFPPVLLIGLVIPA